jgi:hypothetical protein
MPGVFALRKSALSSASQHKGMQTIMSILAGYLSESDLAAQLKKTVRSLQSWRTKRTGPPWTKIGCNVFYSEDGVRAWLKTQEQQPVRSHRPSRKLRGELAA